LASRPRSNKKRGWPDGLYERGGYFSWRNPLNGKEMGIGRVTLGEAKAQASEANVAVQGLRDKPRLVDRLLGKEDTSWAAWLVEYEKKLGERELADNTAKTYKSQVKKIREVWADQLGLPVDKVTTKHISDGLKIIRATHPRNAQAIRSRLMDSFDRAIADGWRTAANPVEVTDEIQVTVQRARLPWEVFKTLYAGLPAGRLKNACALALVSGQARETVVAGLFTQVGPVAVPGREPVECWRVIRGKTGAMIAIPLDLRLDVFGMSLRDVIRQCRGTGVASKHLVHATVRIKGSRLGAPYQMDRLSKDFTAAILALGLDWGGKTAPTFHELRSLSKRLYQQQGGVDTLDLLGHKDEKTGQLYGDARGSEYRVVSIAA
jgi:hypothetical protein